MRLDSIEIQEHPPIKHVKMEGLSDFVVIAGKNGSGKSRLLDEIVRSMQGSPSCKSARFRFAASCDAERAEWRHPVYELSSQESKTQLYQHLQKHQFFGRWSSGVLYYQGQRLVESIGSLKFDWDIPDPRTIGRSGFDATNPMRHKHQETVHALIRLVASHDKHISDTIKLQQRDGVYTYEHFSDPLEPYKIVFDRLLAPKTFDGLDVRQQQLWFTHLGERFGFFSLSAGEKEIVQIAFDFTLRNPSNSIILFDEPEAHLHPEYVIRLLTVLRTIGEGNQFVIATHSPELIAMALEQGSLYVIQPPRQDGTNQAILVGRGDPEAEEILGVLGRSMGVISLGRRVVLIEGKPGGIDERVYRAVAERHFPGEFVFVPMGGRAGLESFEHLNENALKRQLFGVDFFEILDGDELVAIQQGVEQNRLRRLPRCHVENYFLDASIWVELCKIVLARGHETLTEACVEQRMRDVALEVLSNACALHFQQKIHTRICATTAIPGTVGDEHSLPSDIAKGAQATLKSLSNLLEPTTVEAEVTKLRDDLKKLIQSGGTAWKKRYPAKLLMGKLNEVLGTGMDWSRVQTKYMQIAAERDYAPFDEIKGILSNFRALTPD